MEDKYQEALSRLVNNELVPSQEETEQFTICKSKYLQKESYTPEEDLNILSELVDYHKEKEKPVKPNYDKVLKVYYCPKCKYQKIFLCKYIHKYCFNCGAKIDWSDK